MTLVFRKVKISKSLAVLTLLVSCSLAKAESTVVEQLRQMIAEENTEYKNTDDTLTEALREMQKVSLVAASGRHAETLFDKSENKILAIKNSIQEKRLRIEFLNEFLNKALGVSDPAQVTGEILLALAHRQLSSAIETGTTNKLWLFEIYLSVALRDIFEPSENLVEFIRQYMDFSTISEPKSPREFIQKRADYLPQSQSI